MAKLSVDEIAFLRTCPRVVMMSRRIQATARDKALLAMMTKLRQRERPLIDWKYLDTPHGQPMQLDVQLTMNAIEQLRELPR